MIKVAVLYPQSKKFDWDYYINKHTPLLHKLMGPALKKVEIDKGIAGGAPGTAATYPTICTLHSTRWNPSRRHSPRTRRPSWAISRTTPTRSRSCRSAR
jgi:hypothetical protein